MAKTGNNEEWTVSKAVFELMGERQQEGGPLGYEIVVRGPGFVNLRAESIYWTVLASIAEDHAPDESYEVEIYELGA